MTVATTPIEQLAKLIGDDAQLDERIRETQAALTLVKRRVSETLAQHYIATREVRIQMPEDLMREEQSYERLLQALQDMKSEIAKQIRPVEEQIIQANVDHLRQSFSQESRRLSKCIEEVDDNILACRQYLQEHERIRSSLSGYFAPNRPVISQHSGRLFRSIPAGRFGAFRPPSAGVESMS